jgi:hypothetical protein
MSEIMKKIKQDSVMTTYVDWAVNPVLGELRQISKYMVEGYALCLVSKGEITSQEYSQLVHELEKNGEEG